MSFNIIETYDDLSYLNKELLEKKYIAIDTEFRRTKKDNMKLALLQVNDGEEIYLIDSVKIENPDNACDFLFSNSVLKILHSCKEDLEAIYSWTGKTLSNVFDTQIANEFLGGDYSVSYQTLVENQLEIILDKRETRSNWLRRPLTDSQLSYAASDVEFLIHLYLDQKEKLSIEKKINWFYEDINLLVNNTFSPSDNVWQKPVTLTKPEERIAVKDFNKIILRISEKERINQTLFFSKKLQKIFIRNLFSMGIELAFKDMSKWRCDLLRNEIESFYFEYK